MLDPTLAGEGETDLVGHSAAEGALDGGGREGGTWVRRGPATPANSHASSQACAKVTGLSHPFIPPTLCSPQDN